MFSVKWITAQNTIVVYDLNSNFLNVVYSSKCDNCLDMLSVSGSINGVLYQANEKLLSNGQINGLGATIFKAAECIELDGGFEVNINSTFEAIMEPCNASDSPSVCAEGNLICDLAISLDSTGVYTVGALDFNVGQVGSGINSRWYKYESTRSGVAYFSMCDNGVNESINFYHGSCDDLIVPGSRVISRCSGSSESQRYGMFISPGVTYYIQFDDDLSSDGFVFEFEG